MLFVFVEIIFTLLEIVEFVPGACRTGSFLFLPLFLFLAVALQLSVQGIESLNIGQVPDTFVLPAGKDLVRIPEIRFSGGCYRAGTGFCENVHGKSIVFHPVIDHVDLGLNRIPVADPKCF